VTADATWPDRPAAQPGGGEPFFALGIAGLFCYRGHRSRRAPVVAASHAQAQAQASAAPP
jgi:hypothetical protein